MSKPVTGRYHNPTPQCLPCALPQHTLLHLNWSSDGFHGHLATNRHTRQLERRYMTWQFIKLWNILHDQNVQRKYNSMWNMQLDECCLLEIFITNWIKISNYQPLPCRAYNGGRWGVRIHPRRSQICRGIFPAVAKHNLDGNNMMTSSNVNIFRDTGHLWGHRWIPHTKASDAELWCFLWSAPE